MAGKGNTLPNWPGIKWEETTTPAAPGATTWVPINEATNEPFTDDLEDFDTC